MFLRYQQSFQSKLVKYEHRLKELTSKDKQTNGSQGMMISEVEQKVASIKKKVKELSLGQLANDCIRFIKVLKQNSDKIKVAKKYAHELNQVIGQIIDVARIMLLQKMGEDEGKPAMELVLSGKNQGAMTTASSTLNIIQVQQMAFDPDRVQSHLEHLVKQMSSAKALKLAQFHEKKEAGAPLSVADLD